MFGASIYSVNITEDTSPGTSIIQVAASDADSGDVDGKYNNFIIYLQQ